MKIRINLSAIALLFYMSWNIIISSVAQDLTERKTLTEYKESLNFLNWSGKNNPVTSGMNRIDYLLEGFLGAQKVNKKKPYKLLKITGEKYVVRYKSRWIIDKSNSIEILLYFADTSNDAHEYLIRHFYNALTSFEDNIIKKDVPTIVGNASFRDGCIFIRNNIIVKIHAEGELRKKIKLLAKEIDDYILGQPAASTSLPFKPVINRFEVLNNVVHYKSNTKLLVETVDPQGGELHYFWKLTGGGVNEDETGNFYYYAKTEEKGNQQITLFVINDNGYYTKSEIDINIK